MPTKMTQGTERIVFAGFPQAARSAFELEVDRWLHEHNLLAEIRFSSLSEIASSVSSGSSLLVFRLDPPNSLAAQAVYPGGIEEIWSLKLLRSLPPWLAVTERPDLFTQEICSASGAFDYVAPPAETREILHKLQAHLFSSASLSLPDQALSLLDFLQMSALLRTKIRFTLQLSPQRAAEIGLQDGWVCHAALSDGLFGEEALQTILATTRSAYKVSPLPPEWSGLPSILPQPFLPSLPSLLRLAAELPRASTLPSFPVFASSPEDARSTPALSLPNLSPSFASSLRSLPSSSPGSGSSPFPSLLPSMTPPPSSSPLLPPLVPALNALCQGVLRDSEDGHACAIFHLTERTLRGFASSSALFDQTYLEYFAEAAADLFQGPTVRRIEEMLKKHQDSPSQDSFEEFFVSTQSEYYFMKRVFGYPYLAMLLLTDKSMNLGMGWSSLRNRIKDFPEEIAQHIL